MTKSFNNLVTGIWSFVLAPVLCFLVVIAFPVSVRAAVTAEPDQQGLVIKIDGKPFAHYLTKAGHSPAIWPIFGPTGKPVTRAYPFTPPSKDGTNDHPHHQSFWFTHDKVNGIDFWGTNRNDDKGDAGPHVAVQSIDSAQQNDTVRILTKDVWLNGKEKVCEDDRTIVFGQGLKDRRWVDFTIKIHATNGDLTFGDSKEGTFAIRVADSLRVDAKKGGHIVNSEGQENVAAWGMPARWVDYTGPIDGETVGVAIMSHPKSFRPSPRWHVRTYGLFAANPFGQSVFPHPEAAKQGTCTIKNGDTLMMRYLVLLHRGKTDPAEMESAFRAFAAK